MASYLITGVAGFIGSNLLAALLDLGHDVVGLDNFSNGKQENLAFISEHRQKDRFTFIEGDIRDLDVCKRACDGVDFVLHQAALGSVPRSVKEPLLYEQNNTVGHLNLLVAARDAKVKRFVYASSSSVYGDTKILPKVETMVPAPKSPYAISKISGEYFSKTFYELYGLETIGFRYFNVFGPKQDPDSQYSAAIPKFVTALLENKAPTIYGDGNQTRDFTYIDNVVNANLAACDCTHTEAFGKAYNVGCGGRISLNDLIRSMNSIIGVSVDPIYEVPRVGDVRDSQADISLLKEFIGVNHFVDLDEGLKKTVAWYQSL
ncbi:LPS biosynthesis protein WbpP [Candidatus Marinamargulisbacteria bacterium SCGC AG-439-L15]|nr:LPS biosynthesis protein WbpP [Candidatus Marinamargulisbacteria bacterium SCGC AG-439-L15]